MCLATDLLTKSRFVVSSEAKDLGSPVGRGKPRFLVASLRNDRRFLVGMLW